VVGKKGDAMNREWWILFLLIAIFLCLNGYGYSLSELRMKNMEKRGAVQRGNK